MKTNFQERFKNRSNFITKQGLVESHTSLSVIKPRNSQIFDSISTIHQSSMKNLTESISPNKSLSARNQLFSSVSFRSPKSSEKSLKLEFSPKSFKPYTFSEYLCIKSDKYYELGGLGPNIGNEEWAKKKETTQKRRDYSKIVQLSSQKIRKLGTEKVLKDAQRDLYRFYKTKKLKSPRIVNKKYPLVELALEDSEKQNLVFRSNVKSIHSKFEN